MGIRYYAYAFAADATERARANPYDVLGDDPLADAWGLEPHAVMSVATFEQTVPKRDMLYLDKAWAHLQAVTRPPSAQLQARPAYRMFEGRVKMTECGWEPWVRVLAPDEVADIALDLEGITEKEVDAIVRSFSTDGRDPDEDVAYAMEYLDKARAFVTGLARDGRGLVYTIG